MKKSDNQKFKIYIAFLFIVLPFCAISQDSASLFSPHWYINTNVGLSYSQADIAKYDAFPKWPDFENLKPGASIKFGRQLIPAFGLNAGVYYGLIKGIASNGDRFESDLFDYNLNFVVNFNKLFNPSSNNKLNFHGSAGIGQAQYKTKVMDARGTTLYGYEESLGDLKGRGLDGRRVVMVLPISLGFDYKLSEKVQLYADFNLRFSNTDLIDGQIVNGNNDNYNFSSIGIRFNFFKKKKTDSEESDESVINEPPEELPKSEAELTSTQITEINPKMVDLISDKVVAKLRPVLDSIMNPKPVIEKKPEPAEGKEIVANEMPVENNARAAAKSNELQNVAKEYCVQIRASFKKPVDIEVLSDKYDLEPAKIVYKGIHNNWHIYVVGSFKTEKEALRERQDLIKNHGIMDAFVVRFENGMRVND